MRTPKLVRKVGAALSRLLPDHRGKHLGVAISGGPDSVALCQAFVALSRVRSLRLTALHVNHRLRPEADSEQLLVERLCERWHIPSVVESLSPPKKATGIENWARTERYRFFLGAKERYDLDAVALAHTQDDQAETVLFRLLRGSAKRGFAGIPPTRDGWLIRPLLDCTRQEVMAYLAAEDVPYAIDASNADLSYTRNKIRHLLLPLLEREFAPQIRRHLATFAAAARAEEEWLETLARDARNRVVPSQATLSRALLMAEPKALHPRIVRQWLEHSGLTHDIGFSHIDSVLRLTGGRERGKVAIPGGRYVRREGDFLLIEGKAEQENPLPSYSCPLTPGQSVFLPQAGWQLEVSLVCPWSGAPRMAHSVSPWHAVFDAAFLTDAFFVRSFRPGDRIRPLGMEGRRKVHDVFIDAKIPVRLRPLLPLVVVGQEIAWVPGYVRGEMAKVTKSTRFVCQIAVSPLPEK